MTFSPHARGYGEGPAAPPACSTIPSVSRVTGLVDSHVHHMPLHSSMSNRLASRPRALTSYFRQTLTAAAVSLVAACSDTPPIAPPSPGADPTQSVRISTDTGSVAENPIRPRFSGSLEVTGSLRPGSVVHIRGRVRGLLASRDVSLNLLAPELTLLTHDGNAMPRRIAAGSRIPAIAEERRAMGAGDEAILTATLTIPAPGIYAFSAAAEEHLPRGAGRVWESASWTVTQWLVIPTSGTGYVTNEYPAGVFGDSLIRQPGPFTRYPRGWRQPTYRMHGPSDATPGQATAAPVTLDGASRIQSTGGTTSHVRSDQRVFGVRYQNPVTLEVKPLTNALVTVVRCVDGGAYCWEDGYTYTDGNGTVSVACDGWSTTVIDVFLENQHVRWYGGGSAAYFLMWPDCINGGGGYDQMLTNFKETDAFTNMSESGWWATIAGRPRPQLLFHFSSDISASRYCRYTWPVSDCPTTDLVQLRPERAWDERARWTHAHEYGHALHHKALGGIQELEGSRPWDYNTVEHPSRAYVEGFAGFWADVTTGDRVFWAEGWAMNLVRSWPVMGDGGYDGNNVPGQVAGFMYDLYDYESDHAGDNEYVGLGYVIDLVARCEVRSATNGWHRGRYLEHFVYCAEGSFDPSIAWNSMYFRSKPYIVDGARAPYLTAPASPTTQSTVRQLWKQALYTH